MPQNTIRDLRAHILATLATEEDLNTDASTNPITRALNCIDRHPECIPTIARYWAAAKDPSIAMASIETRKNNLVKALVEKTNKCSTGCRNNLAVHMIGCHPDVEVVFDIKDKISTLLYGFLIDHLATTYPTMHPRDFSNALEHITDIDKRTIHQKVLTAIGGDQVLAWDGDAGAHLNACILAMEYINFIRPAVTNGPIDEDACLRTMCQQMETAVNTLADEQLMPRPEISPALRARFVNQAAIPAAPEIHLEDLELAQQLQEEYFLEYFEELRRDGIDPMPILIELVGEEHAVRIAADLMPGANNAAANPFAAPQPPRVAVQQQAQIFAAAPQPPRIAVQQQAPILFAFDAPRAAVQQQAQGLVAPRDMLDVANAVDRGNEEALRRQAQDEIRLISRELQNACWPANLADQEATRRVNARLGI